MLLAGGHVLCSQYPPRVGLHTCLRFMLIPRVINGDVTIGTRIHSLHESPTRNINCLSEVLLQVNTMHTYEPIEFKKIPFNKNFVTITFISINL